MKTGDRINVLIGRRNGPAYQCGVITAVHQVNGEPRFDVRCDSGTALHWCRAESLLPIAEPALRK